MLENASEPDWGPVAAPPPPPPPPPPPKPKPPADELLPDLDQRAPSGLIVTASRGRYKLGFVSAVDNIGRGPVWIVASRPSTAVPVMRATQRVVLRAGGYRAYEGTGILRYTYTPEHSHWHYLRFERYELRTSSDFELVARDHKTGFCLADHYGYAASRVGIRHPHPRFLGSCERGNTRALHRGAGLLGRLHRPLPGELPRPERRHHRRPGRHVLARPPRESVRRHPRAHARERQRVGADPARVAGRARHTPSVRVLRICEAAERCAAPTVP